MAFNVKYIVTVSDEEVLNRWFMKSPLKGAEVVPVRITEGNPAAKLLNRILRNIDGNQWLVFCDEGVRLLKDPSPILEKKNKDVFYAIRGARFDKINKKFHYFDGSMGYQMLEDRRIESAEEGCIMIHSSALKKIKVKFDPKLDGHLIVDFSLQCNAQKMKMVILPLGSTFREKIIPFKRTKF